MANADQSDDWLRVIVEGNHTPHTSTAMRDLFEDRVLTVQLPSRKHTTKHLSKPPSGNAATQFKQYLRERGRYNKEIVRLFKKIYEDIQTPEVVDMDDTDAEQKS